MPRVARRRRAARAGDEPAYGINTGFGSFADVKIAPDALEALQLNLLRSHAAGVGDPLPVRTVRATMALRANVLAKGFSGIRVETLEALIALLNRGVHPCVPVARLGRRERRPGAARAPRAGAGRRRRSARGSTGPRESAPRSREPPVNVIPGAEALARAGLTAGHARRRRKGSR